MENEIYHKIRKYEQKLENEPTNNVYKYKLQYYYQMIGGLSDVVTKKIQNLCKKQTGDDPTIGIEGNQTYKELIKLLNKEPKLLKKIKSLSGDKKLPEDFVSNLESNNITRIIEYIELCKQTYNLPIVRKKDSKIIEVQYNDIRYTIRTYLENKNDQSIYKIINFGEADNKITVTIQNFLLNDIDSRKITHNIDILKQYNVINCPKPICERNIWKKIYDKKLCSEIREEDGADALSEYDIYQYFDDNGNQINLYLKDTIFLILLKQKFGDYIKYITFLKDQKLNRVNINFTFNKNINITFNENIVLTPTKLIEINKPPVPQKPKTATTTAATTTALPTPPPRPPPPLSLTATRTATTTALLTPPPRPPPPLSPTNCASSIYLNPVDGNKPFSSRYNDLFVDRCINNTTFHYIIYNLSDDKNSICKKQARKMKNDCNILNDKQEDKLSTGVWEKMRDKLKYKIENALFNDNKKKILKAIQELKAENKIRDTTIIQDIHLITIMILELSLYYGGFSQSDAGLLENLKMSSEDLVIKIISMSRETLESILDESFKTLQPFKGLKPDVIDVQITEMKELIKQQIKNSPSSINN
jgi:hypothetical protein